MSRPIKTGLDYFPLDIETDDKIELLEAEYGIEGFGIIIKLFQRIYKNGYWYYWTETELLLFSKRINVDRNKVSAVINTAIKIELFSKELFEKHQVLTSSGIQKRYFAAIGRRAKIEITEEYTLIDVSDYDNLYYVGNKSINGSKKSTKESKVNKSKGKEINYKNLFIAYNNSSLTFEEYQEWIDYRNERKKPLTEKSIKQQLIFLSAQPNPSECISISIRSGWQGLFEVRDNGKKTGTNIGTYRKGNLDIDKFKREIATEERFQE